MESHSITHEYLLSFTKQYFMGTDVYKKVIFIKPGYGTHSSSSMCPLHDYTTIYISYVIVIFLVLTMILVHL